MIDEDVYGRLKNLAAGRVHYVRLPQKPIYPALVYNIITSDEQYSDEGHAGLSEYRVQIDAWAKTREAASSLMSQAKSAMRAHFADFRVVNEYDNIREREDETDLYRSSTDFICWQQT